VRAVIPPVLAMVAVVTAAAVGPPRPIAITTYADLPGHHHSAAFTGMSVGGTPVNIREYKGYGYVRLATSGAAAVLTAAASVTSCEVYPRAHGIATTTRGHTCTFPVLAAKQLEVRVNSRERLFVFVDPPEPAAPPCCDGVSVFDVTTYPKVDPTGRTKSTGIQEAIIDVARKSACANANPCTLYFRNGTYLAGQLFLRSRVRLYLQSGAKLKASTNPSDYRLDPGTHRTAFIVAENVSYTGIHGSGAIDGDGLAYRRRNNATSAYPYWNCRTSTNAMCWDSPRLVLIRRSHHITVRDVMMLDPAAWTNHIHYSDRVTYDNVKVLDDRIKFNTDAVDVDASTNVTVRNSFYHGRDDGFCIKSTKELSLIRTSSNIRFVENTVGYGNNATKLGTETHVGGNIDAIVVQNLYVTNHHGRAFGVYVRDGNSVGPTTGITVDGVYVDSGGRQGFAIEIDRRRGIGHVDHVTLRNFNLPRTTGTSTIYGYDESHRVRNVSISGYRIGGVLRRTLSDARIAKNAYTANVTIE
jgi:polygalacturonase